MERESLIGRVPSPGAVAVRHGSSLGGEMERERLDRESPTHGLSQSGSASLGERWRERLDSGECPTGLVLSEEGAKEMGEPSPEALPRCPPLFVDTVGEIERVFLVALEHISQLACYVLVKDGEVHLIVTF